MENDEENIEKYIEKETETEIYLSYPPIPTSPMSGVTAIASLSGRSHQHYDSQVSLGQENNATKCELQDLLIIIGLVMVQLTNAAYMVFLAPLLSQGLNPLFLVCFGSLATGVCTFPFALLFERKKYWPSRIKLMMVMKFILLALGGVTSFQALMMVGIKKTSPEIAAAMPNLAPGIIFIIAACLRFEKVDLNCIFTRAKILGTLLCLGGAIALSLIQTPHIMLNAPDSNPQDVHNDWIIGCVCLLTAVLIVSCNTVLQASTMIDFPAPFTLCSVTSVTGAVFTAIFQVIVEGKVGMGTPSINPNFVIGLVLLGSVVSSICVAFNTWAVKKKGPVMVSMFSPTSTVGSVIFSAIYLHQIVKIGSVIGMILLFSGLYIVLWAKKKETIVPFLTNNEVSKRNINDIERPLLV